MEKVKKYKSILTFTTLCLFLRLLNIKLTLLFNFLNNLGAIAFIGGIFYAYTITLPVSLLFLRMLDGNLIALAMVAASGSLMADYVIFRFFKDELIYEIEEFIKDEIGFNIGGYMEKIYNAIYHSKIGRFIIVPAIASAIIALPLPDEIGIGMLASFKLDERAFVIISFILNFLGIAAIVGALAG